MAQGIREQSMIGYILAGIGAIVVLRWARERWRTRRDKGYSTWRKTGAF